MYTEETEKKLERIAELTQHLLNSYFTGIQITVPDKLLFSRGFSNIADALKIEKENSKFAEFYFTLTDNELHDFINMVAILSGIINNIPASEKRRIAEIFFSISPI